MEEFEPYLSVPPQHRDKLTPAEYYARHEALQVLIAEAVDNLDENRLGIYQEAMSELDHDNPGKGSNHSIDTCSEISPYDVLTPEQARTVELSLNPIKRLSQLAMYGKAFPVISPGNLLPLYMTRGDLIRAAESRQSAERMMELSSRAH